ncbi:o-spanin [Clavibacter phage 33]|nr:o-spanin [Clavibacter phage 33]
MQREVRPAALKLSPAAGAVNYRRIAPAFSYPSRQRSCTAAKARSRCTATSVPATHSAARADSRARPLGRSAVGGTHSTHSSAAGSGSRGVAAGCRQSTVGGAGRTACVQPHRATRAAASTRVRAVMAHPRSRPSSGPAARPAPPGRPGGRSYRG